MPIDYLPCVMGVRMIFATSVLVGSIVLMYVIRPLKCFIVF